MKKTEQQKVHISAIVDTTIETENGSGLLGFVITYPNGKMKNQAIEYDQSNYLDTFTRISALYQKAIIKYGKAALQ